MSDILTKVNQIGLNTAFPIAGQNNSSEGFRQNSRAVLAGLTEASDELTKIQTTRFTFSGDAAGQSDRIGNAVVIGSSDPALEINFTLANTGVTPGIYSTATQDFELTIDAKGRITLANVVDLTSSIDWGNFGAGDPLTPSSTDWGTGSSFNLPIPTFNAKGRLTKVAQATITYGLQDQVLTHNALLVGGDQNTSIELAPPSGNQGYSLVYDGTTIKWQLIGAGTVSGIIAGQGIKVESDPSTPTVSLDLTNLTTETLVGDADLLVWQDVSEDQPKSVTLSDLRHQLVKVSADTAPSLGGNLNVNAFSIFSTNPSGLVLKNSPTNTKTTLSLTDTGLTLQGSDGALVWLNAPVVKLSGLNVDLISDSGGIVSLSSDHLRLNGLAWPNTTPTNGQNLVMTSQGLAWQTPATFYQTIENTIFVGPNGNDTNGNGSLNTPYLTINKALDSVPVQDDSLYTIMLLGGEYNESLDITNIYNIALEGFFASNPSIITGTVSLGYNIKTFQMSKIRIDNSARDVSDQQPVFMVTTGIDSLLVKDCEILRGPNEKSDLLAVTLSGQHTQDVVFQNTTIQGTVSNTLQSQDSARLVISNPGLPIDGWLGIETDGDNYTYINSAPLLKGVRHNTGTLILENIGAIKPVTYQISIDQPSLPNWKDSTTPYYLNSVTGNTSEEDPNNPGYGLDGDPLARFLDDEGDPSETLLLDANGDPIEDPDHLGENPTVYLMTQYIQDLINQDPIVTDYTVGLYSTATNPVDPDNDPQGRLELTNVNFYYDGEFSKIYKSGDCDWVMTRVRRRADQDFISGARIAYDVQPDEGQFLAHFTASGINLRYTDDGSNVPGNVIDAQNANTFQILLAASSTITLKTPLASAYAPGPLTTSGEMYTEILIVVNQDETGGKNVTFLEDSGTGISWLTESSANPTAGGYTFYIFRYFSRIRKWVAFKQADGNSLKISPVTTSSYTLTPTDAGSYIRRNNATTNQVVVPAASDVNFALGTQVQIVQTGPGQTEIQPASGVIINTPDGYFLRKQFSRALLTKIALNTWDLSGDLDVGQVVAPTITVDNNNTKVDDTHITADGKNNS